MTASRKLWLLLLTLFSAVLLPLALPNEFIGSAIKLFGLKPDESFYWGNALLGLVCIAPVFYAVSRAPTFGFASLLGVVFGGVSTALSSYWLMFFQDYSLWTYGGTILGYVGFNALLFPFLRGFSRISGRFRPFLLAIAWTAYEYFKSVGFLGYPWGLIAYPVSGVLPLIQFTDITGVWGLSFLMALVNALFAELALIGFKPVFRRQMAFVGVLVASVLIYGAIRLSTPIPQTDTASFLLVQQNIDPWTAGSSSVTINMDLTTAGIAAAPQKPDLAVWSESSALNVAVFMDRTYNNKKNALAQGVEKVGVPVLTGVEGIGDVAKDQYLNAAVLTSSSGSIADIYGKIHLVPFAEGIPFFEVPWIKKFFATAVGIRLPWTPGNRLTIFKLPLQTGGTLSFAVPICFEDAFANLCRLFVDKGADAFVNITNDSWSKKWSSEIQHFQAARFRAVENRRVLVRSTNGGLSAVVGPWGEIRSRMPFFQRMYQNVSVPIYKEKTLTFYSRFGDWFPQMLIALLFIVLLLDALPKKKGRSQAALARAEDRP
jgi:apolipoprotein N-acyltransferase